MTNQVIGTNRTATAGTAAGIRMGNNLNTGGLMNKRLGTAGINTGGRNTNRNNLK